MLRQLASRRLLANLRPQSVRPRGGLSIGLNRPWAVGTRSKSTISDEISTISKEIHSVSDKVADMAENIAGPTGEIISNFPPDQVGYFHSLGLAQSWVWPSGFFQHIFELAHVYTGLPWWGTILTVTIATRFLMLPLYISSSDGAAKMARIKPDLNELMEKTKVAKDQVEIQKCMLARKKLMTDNNVKILDMVKPLASVPIFLGVFGALSGMAKANVAGLTTEGLAWFQNLAIADPYCGLQVITALLYAITFKVFGGETGAQNMSPVMKKLFTYMPFIAVPLTMSLPAVVCFYFAINSVFSVFQSNLLKNAWVRSKLGISPMVTKEEQAIIDAKLAKTQSDSIMGALRQKYDDAKAQAERKMEQERVAKQAAQDQLTKENRQFVQIKKRH